MPADWKPHRYTSVAPYLIVAGAAREIEFMKVAFDAVEARRFDGPDDTVMHAEVRIDDTIVMVGDAGGDWEPVPGVVHLYVSDVDATFRRALDAGGTSIQEPARRDGDPDRRGGVTSPGGTQWWIGTQVEGV